MVSSGRRSPARDATRPPAARPSRAWQGTLVAVALLLVAGVGAAWWLLRPRRDRVADTIATQRELLAAGAAARRGDVDRIIRNVDHMSRDEVKKVHAALTKEWEELRREMERRYLAAPANERLGLIDANLDQWVMFRELLLAITPSANPQRAPRRGRPRPAAVAANQAAAPEQQYVEAIRARATARGIPAADFR